MRPSSPESCWRQRRVERGGQGRRQCDWVCEVVYRRSDERFNVVGIADNYLLTGRVEHGRYVTNVVPA